LEQIFHLLLHNKSAIMNSFLEGVRQRARQLNKCIVLPEGEEERTLIAANEVLKENLARIILMGYPEVIRQKSKDLNLEHISKAEIVFPDAYEKRQYYADLLYEIRKNKGMTPEQAYRLAADPLYLASLFIKDGKADGEVAGAINTTGNVLRPAFQIVKTLPGVSVVSGAYIMIFKDSHWGENGMMIFADCAVNPDPTECQLAEIAVMSARTARILAGIEPRVAMLSFSTKGSATHTLIDKVSHATEIAKEIDPSLMIDGELQADAAIVEEVAKRKCPNSPVGGKANVLIFPDLQSGNISYKLVQRLGGADAIGPVLQGMAAPVNDLSRGCSSQDITNLIAITVIQAGGL
jgi:phosphate acetyltransferase